MPTGPPTLDLELLTVGSPMAAQPMNATIRRGRRRTVVPWVDNIAAIGHILSTMNAMGSYEGVKMTHRRITPSLGRRIIDSALYNGDSVPDVILTTAQVAIESRRTTDTREVAAEFERQGRRIDRNGWVVFED